MSKDTLELLKECNAGCKSATNSMEQVQAYVKDSQLRKIIEQYNKEHILIGDECHKILDKAGETEKDPSPMAKTFSWISTEIKMMINDDEKKIADIMVDGCNMGIKALSRYLNEYKEADKESRNLTKKLIRLEQDFMNDLLGYL
ncbi:putative uncharacterized protein [Clostridium sp. CAG:411]|jgi:hypothetical protein|nr:hypothetical protein [Lachnospiraceae bacterium]CDE46058.1 putative uncharacterized protein [Clostridium sp. CAG:411]